MINTNKLLDLRFVIGLFFTVIGLLLLIHSFITSLKGAEDMVNSWTGIVFLVFGVGMIVLSSRRGAED